MKGVKTISHACISNADIESYGAFHAMSFLSCAFVEREYCRDYCNCCILRAARE